MKVAIVHYWLTSMRGGEKVVEALCDLYPEADVFTNVYDRRRIAPAITCHRVRTTFVDRLPFAKRLFRQYLPLMPLALEQLDLRDYDVVVSVESGPAKGIIPPLDGVHICYCLSPMRYVWDMYRDYLDSSGWLTRQLMRPVAHYLRVWDTTSAARVDHFATLSEHTRRRVTKYYRRDAEILAPPVETSRFAPTTERGDFYLVAGQLEHYKRVDLAIEACAALGRPLVIIGEGVEDRRLRRLAGASVRFLGWQPDDVLHAHYARCRALLFPGVEDFGLVPVECMASGRPVIAYGRGGALEYVREGTSGLLFPEQSAVSLAAAIERFEATEASLPSSAIVEHARSFDRSHFMRQFAAMVDRVRAEHA